jgi:hypothetical protein
MHIHDEMQGSDTLRGAEPTFTRHISEIFDLTNQDVSPGASDGYGTSDSERWVRMFFPCES